MAAGGVTFGGHGADASGADDADRRRREAEVQKCRRRASSASCPDALSAFCYPNGNMDPSIAASVRRHRFRVAFGTDLGLVGRGSPLFSRCARVNMHEDVTRSRRPVRGRMLGLV